MPGNLAFTSVTIADAREVFEIVIEKQLMVLYAIKIYCKHINERDMGIFWCQPLIFASNWSSGIRRTRPWRELDPVKVGPPENSAPPQWQGHDPGGMTWNYQGCFPFLNSYWFDQNILTYKKSFMYYPNDRKPIQNYKNNRHSIQFNSK